MTAATRDDRPHARSGRRELGGLGIRRRHRLPDSEPAVRRVPAAGRGEAARVGVAIGDLILDVGACARAGLFSAPRRRPPQACDAPALNALMARGGRDWTALRHAIHVLDADAPATDRIQDAPAPCLVPQADVEMLLPATIGDYTDFYASVHHATNVGSMMRPDNPLLPNYKYVPIGYHGRASSIVVSGTPVRRPWGQTKAARRRRAPCFGPSRRLDYELEVGVFIGPGNALGSPVPIDATDDHLFGLCLVNDWSARDIQAWEYQPLGPFLAKNFAHDRCRRGWSRWTRSHRSASPRAPGRTGDPAPLPYLDCAGEQRAGRHRPRARGVHRDAPACGSAGLRASPPQSRAIARDSYWTFGQIVAHHTSNGCNLRPGDLLASGTVSGPSKDSRGCLLELTWRGTEPITLPSGEERRFLEDGDEVVLRGTCRRPGAATNRLRRVPGCRTVGSGSPGMSTGTRAMESA